jgi:hypothetical protein
MVKTKFFLLLLFIPLICQATDLKPWFGNKDETKIRASLLYQDYRSLSIPDLNRFKRDEKDLFLTMSATYPFKRYCGEFEITGARTHYQNNRIDNFRITGRYQWLDDTEGDPISLTLGITLTEALSRALHDVSSFHHGHIEGEAFLSLGKKYGHSLSKDYRFRWWNVFGAGVADNSTPWLQEDAAFEYNYNDIHLIRGFVNTLWGMGHKNLNPYHFCGYGYINHRSVDLGIRYGYKMGCWGTLSIQYARRVYARNFPQDANLVLLECKVHFGTQNPYNY